MKTTVIFSYSLAYLSLSLSAQNNKNKQFKKLKIKQPLTIPKPYVLWTWKSNNGVCNVPAHHMFEQVCENFNNNNNEESRPVGRSVTHWICDVFIMKKHHQYWRSLSHCSDKGFSEKGYTPTLNENRIKDNQKKRKNNNKFITKQQKQQKIIDAFIINRMWKVYQTIWLYFFFSVGVSVYLSVSVSVCISFIHLRVDCHSFKIRNSFQNAILSLFKGGLTYSKV